MKTALVQDWLMAVGGAEKCLHLLLELFPSPLFTLVHRKEALSAFDHQAIEVSFIQKLPLAKKFYPYYLPLFPLAIEQFDLSSYDLILSSSHCVAKGVLTHAEQLHICYCHTPMRYAWDLYHSYLSYSHLQRGFKGHLAKLLFHYLRSWDLHSANRVDHYLANSHYVARRIKKTYRREASVIYPPIATNFFTARKKKESFYLTAARLVPYKRVDLIVEAFQGMKDQTLIVIGEGPELKKLKAKASKNIEFLGYQSNAALRDYLQRAKAFIFAALEDFGMLPLEAQACGTPVIAYGRGGSLETVIEGETGFFFQDQTVNSLIKALKRFEKEGDALDPSQIRRHAEKFSEKRFKEEIKTFVTTAYHAFSLR